MIHRHQWRVIDVVHMEDVSFGEPGLKRTDLLRRCERCRKISRRKKSVHGWWPREHFIGETT